MNQIEKIIDIATWNRREHYEHFSAFDDPFFGVTVQVDCTRTYQEAKTKGISFSLFGFNVYNYGMLNFKGIIENIYHSVNIMTVYRSDIGYTYIIKHSAMDNKIFKIILCFFYTFNQFLTYSRNFA